MEHCPICNGRHESAMFDGIKYVGCPEVPENLMIPLNRRDNDGKLEIAMAPKKDPMDDSGFAEKHVADRSLGILVHVPRRCAACGTVHSHVESCPIQVVITQAEFENNYYGKFDRVAELERAVIEAANNYAQAGEALSIATRALLKARETNDQNE